jgi:hypothetical protein
LTNEEVDHLLQAGSRLLRDNPELQRLLRDLGDDAATAPETFRNGERH